MAFTKFVVHNGRIATRETIALDALDERCLTTARDALTRLRTEQSAVPVVSDKTEVVVGLGVPTLHVPEERLPEAQREAWVAGRLTAERTQRAPRSGPSPERIRQFWSIATQIIAGAPAFMCAHRLNGAAAAFADCFAIAMLTDSVARTTAA